EAQYPGIVIQAVGLTLGTLASLLFLYKTGIVKPTENFRLMVTSGTMGIGLLYLASMFLDIDFIHSNGLFGIGFSLFTVAMAALNLVLDFDFIEQGSEMGAPKYMEWFGAFSLMVTLIWLYLEMLRLLAKLRSR
ncbi:MAG: Bax inhibitor-1/YccA family protein, partial [Porticoccaceae bacterium]|nr:Bax inhibitor-1/YccA family protein [Porticoccaceae bacterium]